MHVFARAMRGPSWLAWLSLLFALQIAAADPVVGPDVDDGQDRVAVHASGRPRPLPAVIIAAGAALGSGPHNLTHSAALLPVPAPPAPARCGGAPRLSLRRLASSTASARLHSRAPPSIGFL